MDKIIVAIGGIVGIGFVAWFFFGKREEAIEVKNSVDIVVKGGYNPSTISVKKDKKTTLNFTRTDPSSCLEEVVLSDFRVRKYLPLNEKVPIEIAPEKTGEFPFSCGMNMFHGKIIVEDPEQSRRIT